MTALVKDLTIKIMVASVQEAATLEERLKAAVIDQGGMFLSSDIEAVHDEAVVLTCHITPESKMSVELLYALFP